MHSLLSLNIYHYSQPFINHDHLHLLLSIYIHNYPITFKTIQQVFNSVPWYPILSICIPHYLCAFNIIPFNSILSLNSRTIQYYPSFSTIVPLNQQSPLYYPSLPSIRTHSQHCSAVLPHQNRTIVTKYFRSCCKFVSFDTIGFYTNIW